MRALVHLGLVLLQALALVSVQPLAAAAQVAAPASTVSSHPWGNFQALVAPQSRLTFLVQNAYLEKLERDLQQSPKLSRFLMKSLSLPIEERLAAIRGYREWWIRSDEIWSMSRESDRNEKSSLQIRSSYLSLYENSARGRYMKLMLEQGFHDFTLAGLRSLESLEGEKILEVRLVQLAAVLGHMVRDQDNLEVLASLSNFLLTIATDKSVEEKLRQRILPHANELSQKVAKALRAAEGIDVLNPVNLVGGAVFFRGASQVLAKSSFARGLFSKWNSSSTLTKAVTASVAGHAVVVTKALEGKPNLSADQELIQAARERMQNPGLILQQNAARLPVVSSASLSIDGLSALAQSLLYAPSSSVEHAKKYGELVAYSERHLRTSKRVRAGKSAISPDEFLRLRNDVSARFRRYMSKRGLTEMDEEAIAVLRGYISPFIPAHNDGQDSALVAIGTPNAGGNCVTRALIYTSIFYPLLAQYPNPNYRYGLMLWTNHIEPILYIQKSDVALAIPSLQVIEKPDRPSLLEPRVLAASFLFRASSRSLHKTDASSVKHAPYPKSKMAIFKGRHFDIDLSSGEVEKVREMDPNTSPLTTFIYSDNIKATGGVRDGMNSRPLGLNPLSEVSKVRDLLKALVKNAAAPVEQLLSPMRLGEGHPDPMQTELTNWESGLASFSRKPTRFPLGFDGPSIIKFYFPAKDFIRFQRTPDKTRSDFEIRIQRTLNEALNSEIWRRLKSADGLSLAEFRGDLDAQMAIIGFAKFVDELKKLNESDQTRGLRDTFKMELERYLETTGRLEDLTAVAANAKRAIRSLVSDKSGRELVRYLEMANTMSSADRVRHLLALYGYVILSGQMQEFGEIFKNLEFEVREFRAPEVKSAEAQSKEKTESRGSEAKVPVFSGGGKPVMFSLVLTKPSKPVPVKGTLDPEVAFLLVHHFWHVMPNKLEILQGVVSTEKKKVGELKILKFASRFFAWMPQIDSFGSWQAEQADRWVDLGQLSLCLNGQEGREDSKAGRVCEFVKKLDQELQIHEIEEDFQAPELGSN